MGRGWERRDLAKGSAGSAVRNLKRKSAFQCSSEPHTPTLPKLRPRVRRYLLWRQETIRVTLERGQQVKKESKKTPINQESALNEGNPT